MPEQFKRETAYKLRVGDILKGNPVIEQSEGKERFRVLELTDKAVKRVNIVANIVDKYVAEGEKKYISVTVDDASGQVRVKAFGEDTNKLTEINQGDTVVIIGLLRSYNNELYILPEIVRKIDPRYLLVRKLELEPSTPQESAQENGKEKSVKDQIIELIKAGEADGGVDTEQLILKLNTVEPSAINSETSKLIEDGVIYEPRPGRVMYLG